MCRPSGDRFFFRCNLARFLRRRSRFPVAGTRMLRRDTRSLRRRTLTRAPVRELCALDILGTCNEVVNQREWKINWSVVVC